MLIIILLVFGGLCLGSFVNALVWRMHLPDKSIKQQKRYSIVSGRSMCPNCRHELDTIDLIPVVSWLFLKGRCRYCHKPISWQYPLVELIVPALFVISYIGWPLEFNGIGLFDFVLWLVFITAFVALSIYDIRWFLLPDKIVYPMVLLGVAEIISNATVFGGGEHLITQAFWGALSIAGLFYVLHIISKGAWIGFGDVKLSILLGLLVGSPLMSLAVIFIASVLGSVVAVPLLIQGRAKSTTQIPFGPFLMLATLMVVLFGVHISNAYQSTFLIH